MKQIFQPLVDRVLIMGGNIKFYTHPKMDRLTKARVPYTPPEESKNEAMWMISELFQDTLKYYAADPHIYAGQSHSSGTIALRFRTNDVSGQFEIGNMDISMSIEEIRSEETLSLVYDRFLELLTGFNKPEEYLAIEDTEENI